MNNQNQKKNNSKWLTFINIPIQMGVIIFGFASLGNWLDDKYPNTNSIYVKIATLIGVSIAFYNLNRQLKEINNN
jgi:F0F1-type ATP synthase assembly protein I